MRELKSVMWIRTITSTAIGCLHLLFFVYAESTASIGYDVTKMSQDDSDCGMGCTRGSTGFGSDGVVSDSQIILRAFGCTKNRLPAFRK